jgi:hypothetical protein
MSSKIEEIVTMEEDKSKLGIKFENYIFENLQNNFPKLIIRKEKEIISDYGKDITAIDIEIFREIKTKDLGKIKNIHVFIQCKWKDKTETIKNINHFIQCCNEITKMKKINEEDINCFYVSKVPISTSGQEAIKKLKNGENIYDNNMESCLNFLLKKISEIFNIKISKKLNLIAIPNIAEIKTTEIIKSPDLINYEELKKNDLILLAVKDFKITKTVARSLKHNELVRMLKNKEPITPINISNKTKEKINSKILHVEFDEPNLRCPGELKSKLLKPGSELYGFITKLKNYLRSCGFPHQDRMGLHSEVLNDDSESLDVFLNRVKFLEGKKIDVMNFENYDVIGRAVALLLGNLEGYNKDSKITIAFLNDVEIAEKALHVIKNYISNNNIVDISKDKIKCIQHFKETITKDIEKIEEKKELPSKCYFEILHDEINPTKIFLDKLNHIAFDTKEKWMHACMLDFKKGYEEILPLDYTKMDFSKFNNKSANSYLYFIHYMISGQKNKVYMCNNCIAIAEKFNY